MVQKLKESKNVFFFIKNDKLLIFKGRPLANIDEPKCQECMFKESLCLDYDNDGLTEECWCPRNENCQRSLTSTKYSHKNMYAYKK